MNLTSQIKIIIGAIVCIVAFGGTLWKAHDYMEQYALAEDHKALRKDFEYEKKAVRLEKVQERIWRMEGFFDKRPPTPIEKEELRGLKEQENRLKGDLGIK